MIDMHQEAVNDFNVVIKKNPKNAHAYFRRAFSLKALKRYPEAAEDFESAKNCLRMFWYKMHKESYYEAKVLSLY